MSDPLGEQTQPRVEVNRWLIDAKLSVPSLRAGLVSRTALVEAARESECRVVAVTAPAGYGKSTFLAEWAHAERRPVLWVSLDRLDNDPSAVLTLIAAAYARASAGHDELVGDVSGVSPLGRAAPHLASVLRASQEPFVLMIDDVHELRSVDCHDVLSVVLAGVPPGSQLVAASRRELPFLPRLRAAGDAVEILAADLALDATGAEQVFAHAQVEISSEVAAELAAGAEGWPVGLYLAALIARDNGGRATPISGEHRLVADYLYTESFSQLPDATKRFLRRTAILEQLSAELCDAVTGGSGGQQALRRLEASNSFLVPMDQSRHWYRYHALYREFLLSELRRVEPEKVMKLHLRAAEWYEANASPALALEHLLQTSEHERCVQLVTQVGLATYGAGQIATVQRWLTALGDAAIEAHPPLAVLAGWIAAMSGQTVRAQRWAAFVDTVEYGLVPLDGSASFDSARAMLRAFMCAEGPEQMLSDAGLAMSQEPPWSPWRDTALIVSAHAHLLVGEVEPAAVLFAETARVALAAGNNDTVVDSEAELAVIDMDRGRWTDAAAHVGRALDLIERHRMHDYPTSVVAFAAAARLALHQADLEQADREVTRALRARLNATLVMPYHAVRSRLQIAKVYWARGDHAAARHLMREIDDLLRHRPALGTLVDDVAEFRTSIAASMQAGATSGPPLTAAELRLLPYLQTHLTLTDIGERLFISRNTVATEVASIYRKLGVSSRGGAVERSTALGLLGS